MSETPHVMIAEARFYADIADELALGAIEVLEAAGASYERVDVPGAFELPAAIKMALKAREFATQPRRFDGFIALGCVIRGETSHYDIICSESARALQELVREFTLAVGYGILTVDNAEQANERAQRDRRNKGGEAAMTCLHMIGLKESFSLYPR